jgi:TolB protein
MPDRLKAPLACALFALLTALPLTAQTTFGGYPAARAGGNYMQNYYLPPAPSSTPWYPSWAPDGGHVAVAMSGSIWSVELSTGVATELVSGPAYYSSPSYSPDGRWLVYTADDHGRSINLEAASLETGARHTLTEGGEVYADPSFSPDGTRIVYVSTGPTGYFNVYIRGIAEGSWTGPAEAVTTDHSFGKDRLYFGSEDIHISPAWFPSGEELLLVSNRDVPLGSGNVFRVPARTAGFEDRVPVLVEQTLYRTQPDVSPDGHRFIFSSTRATADQFNNLYLQPTVGGEPYKLTFYEHDAFHPRWSPDGEWIAYIDNRNGLPQLKLLETYGGKVVDVEITERRWKRPVGTLRVRTVGPTNMLVASRIHLKASDNKFYAPTDAYARISQRGRDWIFQHPGSFEVELPVGPVELTAVKGFENAPVTRTAEIRGGETTELTLRLEPVIDMAANGWFNASTHVHLNYAGNMHNTLENLMMVSDAEDQDLVLEEIANKDNRVLDHQFFVPGGGPHPLSTPERVLVVGEEYRPPFYGHVFLFGLRDHLISPFTTGYEGTAIESLYPSNTDIFRKAKAQGAWTGYQHPFFFGDPLETGLGNSKGFLVDAALGTIDALEWSVSQNGYAPLYAAWNNGLRVTVVGGEDSIGNLHQTALVASVRTYVKTASGTLSMKEWFEGMAAGHAFMTTGPLIDFEVNGRISGEEVAIDSGEEVTVRFTVTSITPLEKAELIFNGEVVAEIPFTGERTRLSFERTFRPERSGWYHLRVNGKPGEQFPLDIPWAQALTNPVWITVDGAPVRSAAAADYGIAWVDKLQEMAEAWPGWRSQREKDHVYAQFEEAREVYRRLKWEAGGSPPPAS